MSTKSLHIDKPFLFSVIILVVFGLFIFISASMGLLTRDGATFSSVTFNQIVLGFIGGMIAFIITSNISYKNWRSFAFYIFLFSIFLTLLVFVPKLGFAHGGAKRWLIIGPFPLQPSELLKIGFIIYFAAWIASVKDKASTFLYGALPFVILLSIVGGILLMQPDTDTFLVIFMSGLGIFLVGGGRWRYIFFLIIASVVGLLIIAQFRPYVQNRIDTFLHPERDPTGTSYQFQQSLIAIGAGGFAGRGFGQSIQKFGPLPEPIGDSIFAVASEEFGFIGGVILIFLFLFFTFRGLKIASKSPDAFGRLLVSGIVILIISQAFVNIAAMLGVMPLSGIPLPFVSHGGTALFMTLAEVGIIVNVSKYKTTRDIKS